MSPWGVKGLDHTYCALTYKSSSQEKGPKSHYLWGPMGFAFTSPSGQWQTKKQLLNRCMSYFPRLSTERTDKNAHFPVFPQKGFDYIIYQLLRESLASNKPTSRCRLGSSPEPEKASGYCPQLLSLVHSNNENQHQLGRRQSTHLALQLLWQPTKGQTLKSCSSDNWWRLHSESHKMDSNK